MKKWYEMSRRERDALVAEKVMGWTAVDEKYQGGGQRPDLTYTVYPHYTADISSAWEVVEKLKLVVSPQSDEAPKNMKYMAMKSGFRFNELDYFTAFAPTAPEAICLAALRAVGVDV